MNFESLYEMIELLNESTNEKCLICHLPIEDDELILSCNHYYHSKCLNKKTIKIKCHYCAKIVTEKKKDKKEGKKKYKKRSINESIKKDKKGTINEIIKEDKKSIGTNCEVILLTGLRKGESCGRHNCPYHVIKETISQKTLDIAIINFIIKNNTNLENNSTLENKITFENNTILYKDECTSIIKTGLRKGSICGRYQCKIHTINL